LWFVAKETADVRCSMCEALLEGDCLMSCMECNQTRSASIHAPKIAYVGLQQATWWLSCSWMHSSWRVSRRVGQAVHLEHRIPQSQHGTQLECVYSVPCRHCTETEAIQQRIQRKEILGFPFTLQGAQQAQVLDGCFCCGRTGSCCCSCSARREPVASIASSAPFTQARAACK
jgi:hypothetical protein